MANELIGATTDGLERRQSIKKNLSKSDEMYGLIGKIVATDGNRDRLAATLIDGISGMPGCLSYIVAQDSQNENALWITEVWQSQELHQASLLLESVQGAINLGKPLIESFAERHQTTPLGGQGIANT